MVHALCLLFVGAYAHLRFEQGDEAKPNKIQTSHPSNASNTSEGKHSISESVLPSDVGKAFRLSEASSYPKYTCKELGGAGRKMGFKKNETEWYPYCKEFFHAKSGDASSPAAARATKQKRSLPCLVYSFGIAKDWAFDRALAEDGCEVHSFDPTTPTLPPDLVSIDGKPGAKFHLWGIKTDFKPNICNGKYSWKAPKVAPNATFMSLDEIVDRLGHRGRPIDILKLDCEGCEWSAFLSSPRILEQTKQLLVELHFSQNLGLKTPHDLTKVGSFYDQVLGHENARWKLLRMVTNMGCRGDDNVLPALSKHGYGGGCCRVLTLVNDKW